MSVNNTEKKDIQKQITAIMNELPVSELHDLLRDAKILQHNAAVKVEYDKNRELRANMPEPDKSLITVKEMDDGNQFFINFNGHSSVYTRDEMKKIVSIAQGAADPAEGSARLYTWLERERRDVIRNSHITGKSDPSLGVFIDFLVNNYTVKK